MLINWEDLASTRPEHGPPDPTNLTNVTCGHDHSFWLTTIHGPEYGPWFLIQNRTQPKNSTQKPKKTDSTRKNLTRHVQQGGTANPTRPNTMHRLGVGHAKRPMTRPWPNSNPTRRLKRFDKHLARVVHIDNTSSLSLKKTFEALLFNHCLTMAQIHGQDYDRSSSMKEEIKGLKHWSCKIHFLPFYLLYTLLCTIILTSSCCCFC